MQVLTQHYDNARTGANLQETILTPTSVASDRFGKLAIDISVDGHVYAQPLYLGALDVPGVGRRNVLYVATMRNWVYAFDADAGGPPLWQRRLGPYVKLPDSNIGGGAGYQDISDAVGIVGTPVISLDNHAIYVVAMIHEGDEYHHRLHALDLGTGQDKPGSPVLIQGSVPGKGAGAADGWIAFTSRLQNQRPGLLLSHETVYVAFASYGDHGDYHGWVFGFDAGTLRPRPNIFNTTPHGTQAGIWMAGQGPAADADGNIYVMTGNGTFKDAAAVAKHTFFNETAIGHPALAATDGSLVLAWTGTDEEHRLNVLETIDGVAFDYHPPLAETSIDGPALAYGDHGLFIAWTGTDSEHRLNVAPLAGGVLVKKMPPLAELSDSGPALAFGAGQYFLAWTGTDSRLNIMRSPDGVTWDPAKKVTLPETSGSAPGLCFDAGRLYLLWSGTDEDHRLNIRESTDAGQTFHKLKPLDDTSDFHPALVRHGMLHLLWTGRDAPQHLNQRTGPTPANLGIPVLFGDRASSAPAPAVWDGRLYLAWTGVDGHGWLNLAVLEDRPQLGDSFVKLAPDLTVADWFSPWNTQQLNRDDDDLGSGGVLVLPASNLIVGGGKEGKLYALDRDNLGKFCTTCHDPAGDVNAFQWWQATGVGKGTQQPPEPPDTARHHHHIHGSPVYWSRLEGDARIYVWGEADWLRAFAFYGQRFGTTPVDISDVTTPALSMPGAMLTLSAHGNHGGIIWACHPVATDANHQSVAGMIRAIDADHLERELWNSTLDPGDDLGLAAKFTPPTVADGKVYVATFSGKICVYGLRPRR